MRLPIEGDVALVPNAGRLEQKLKIRLLRVGLSLLVAREQLAEDRHASTASTGSHEQGELGELAACVLLAPLLHGAVPCSFRGDLDALHADLDPLGHARWWRRSGGSLTSRRAHVTRRAHG